MFPSEYVEGTSPGEVQFRSTVTLLPGIPTFRDPLSKDMVPVQAKSRRPSERHPRNASERTVFTDAGTFR